MHTAHQYRIAALSLKSLSVVTCLLLAFFLATRVRKHGQVNPLP